MLYSLDVCCDLSELLRKVLSSHGASSKVIEQRLLLPSAKEACALLAAKIPKVIELGHLLVHDLLPDLLKTHDLVLNPCNLFSKLSRLGLFQGARKIGLLEKLFSLN